MIYSMFSKGGEKDKSEEVLVNGIGMQFKFVPPKPVAHYPVKRFDVVFLYISKSNKARQAQI